MSDRITQAPVHRLHRLAFAIVEERVEVPTRGFALRLSCETPAEGVQELTQPPQERARWSGRHTRDGRGCRPSVQAPSVVRAVAQRERTWWSRPQRAVGDTREPAAPHQTVRAGFPHTASLDVHRANLESAGRSVAGRFHRSSPWWHRSASWDTSDHAGRRCPCLRAHQRASR